MDIKKLTQEVLLKNMTPEQQMAVLDSVQASVKEAKAVQKQKIAENVDLVLQALKRIEADMIKRVDGSAQVVENRVKTIKDGKDGKNGIDGKAGRDGKDGKNGSDGRNGKDGLNGISGERGQDGVGVQNAHIDFDGSLIIALTDGRELNVGEVVPFDVAEKIRVIGNGGGTSQYVVDTLADLQTQINNISGGLTYKGTWNASSNTPTLTSSAGTKGWYYVVSTAGSTNLNGVTDWQVGDWAIYNGSTWQKIDQTNLVTSVAGRTGDVTIAYSDLTGTTPTWNQNTTGTAANVTGTVAVTNGGTGSTTASGARTNLGVGTIATQNDNSVAITGGAIDGTTVGATTRSSGDFTTLSANTVTSTTPVLSFNASNTIASFGSTTANSYNQLVIQNKSATASASTNYVLSNNLGTDSTYYGEFGMNASTYSSGTPADFFSLNNGVYFSAHDGDVTIGSGNGYKTYLAWGTSGQSAHVVNATGAIGLNTNITGTSNFGTSGQVLTSAGSAATPTWTTPAAGTVTSVTGTSPVVSSGGNTPAISLATSYGDTQNPYASKTANYILAAPNGSAGVPTFRAIVAADIPTLNQNTTGSASGGASGAIAATTLSASSTISGTGFSTYLASPPAIGGTAAAAVSSTALSYTTTLTGGTGIVNLGSGQFYKDASGNVGIGTSSPAYKFDVVSATDGTLGEFKSTSTANNTALRFGLSTSDAYISAAGTSSNLTFLTVGSERARIDSSGNLLVGTTTSGSGNTTGFTLNNPAGSSFISIGHITGTATGYGYSIFCYNGSTIGSITQAGTTGVLYNVTSDYRLKNVIGSVTGSGERIDALEPIEYQWKSDGSHTRGFLAHKFQEVYPQSVSGKKDAVDEEGNPQYQNMQAGTSEVIADLIAEIQSLRKRLTALENK